MNLKVHSAGFLLLFLSAAVAGASAQLPPERSSPDYRVVKERPDQSKGESARSRTEYVPTGELVSENVFYDGGQRMIRKCFHYGMTPALNGKIRVVEEYRADPRLADPDRLLLVHETLYSLGDPERILSEYRFRFDGTREQSDHFNRDGSFTRVTYREDGQTVLKQENYGADGNPLPSR